MKQKRSFFSKNIATRTKNNALTCPFTPLNFILPVAPFCPSNVDCKLIFSQQSNYLLLSLMINLGFCCFTFNSNVCARERKTWTKNRQNVDIKKNFFFPLRYVKYSYEAWKVIKRIQNNIKSSFLWH